MSTDTFALRRKFERLYAALQVMITRHQWQDVIDIAGECHQVETEIRSREAEREAQERARAEKLEQVD
jgi:hypothetical protein